MSGAVAWQVCLFTSIAMAIYPLAIYPAIIKIISVLRPRRVRRAAHRPLVTILVPAYNEVAHIGTTLDHLLAQDYPADRRQILVISDASDDGTDAVVRSYGAQGVELLRRPERAGKAAGLNAGVRLARGEIIVFSDANARFSPSAVSSMVENFADPEVGYVTGHLTLSAIGAGAAGGGAYIKYENWLRRLETRAGSVIGVNGGVDAMRAQLYFDVPPDQITDFVLPLGVIRAGYRVVYDERASSTEDANEDSGTEFRMRVRVALRALRGLVYMRAVLDPLRYPLPALCIVSHKVLRYFTFVFLLLALLSNLVLAAGSAAFAAVLALQCACYLLGLIGISRRLPAALARITFLPSYFLASNAAFAVAAARFLRGDVVATWKPRSG